MGRMQKPKGKDKECKIVSSNNDIPLQICSYNTFLKLPDMTLYSSQSWIGRGAHEAITLPYEFLTPEVFSEKNINSLDEFTYTGGYFTIFGQTDGLG